jgi:hypothetical protein
MSEEEYLMRMAMADRLREARAATAGRTTLGSRPALGGSLAGTYLDRGLLAFGRGVRLCIAGAVGLGRSRLVHPGRRRRLRRGTLESPGPDQ